VNVTTEAAFSGGRFSTCSSEAWATG